jgi:hypothetical protein
MQDRYTGDVGDYGKYGLLRMLCRPDEDPALCLGVVWYLVPCESHNADGKHTSYLQQGTLRRCDPELFDSLKTLFLDSAGYMREDARKVAAIEKSAILPPGTQFFSEPLAYKHGTSVTDRLSIRNKWLQGALATTQAADVVFFDPDNGIECKRSRTSKFGPKYAYWDDVHAFLRRGQSIVLYHHMYRQESCAQVDQIKRGFRERFPGADVSATIYTKGTRRAYFIAAQGEHQHILARRLARLYTTAWAEPFLRVP